MRSLSYPLFVLLVFSMSVFSSCEKEDTPVILPPKGSAIPATITMGETYDDAIYFDFETGTVVKTSPVAAWDISFESSRDGYHLFVNGGMDMYVYNTQTTNAYSVNNAMSADIATEDFAADFPSGRPDSTAIGEWRDASGISKNLVYILKYPDKVFRKIIIQSVDDNSYVLSYGGIDDATMQTITIPKEDQYARAYFSFANGGSIVHPEPPKDNWDIVFTRYHHVFRDMGNVPYLLAGALLNPYNTVGYDTMNADFNSIEYSAAIENLPFTSARDVVGYDWKTYNFAAGKYAVDPSHCYIIRNRRGAYYKLHFLDFYDPQGIKGTPSFEYQRIQ